MNRYLFIFITILSFISGLLLFAFFNDWIIFRYPSYRLEVNEQIKCMSSQKRDVDLLFWNNKKWNKEKINLLWSDNKAKNIQYLINSWLMLLDEEQVTQKEVSLQAVLLSSSGTQAFLSFDRNPFASDSCVYEKWMWLEGLLKTIRDNDIVLQDVQFLVHHQIMDDDHLDFSRPWPIYGFLGP